MSYLKRHGTRRVPQWAPLPGQVPNSAGGYAWAVDAGRGCAASCPRLGGRLVLRVRVEADARERAGGRAVRPRGRPARGGRDRRASRREGRAPKNDPALFALALAAGVGDVETRQAALDALPQVARTGTHLFQFAPFVEGFRGWGRSLRRAVGRWYAAQPVDALAYQAVKYRQRAGVTHRDLLRLAHPARRVGAGNPALDVSDEHARLFEWIVRGGETDGLPRLVEGFARAQAATTPRETAALVREYRLPREALQPEHLTSPEVWEALLDGHADDGADPQPGDDDARRRARAGLGRHGEGGRAARRRGADPPGAGAPDRACSRRSARTRRVAVSAAAATWSPVREIVDALDAAFYTAFGNVEPAGKRLLLALDVSGSMARRLGRRRAGPDARATRRRRSRS